MSEKPPFAHYQEVEIAPGCTVKVAPLRLNSQDNIAFLEEVGESMEATGSLFIYLRRASKVVAVLRTSLAENHTATEVEEAINKLCVSLDKGSPYMNCIFALMGRSLKAAGD